MPQNVIIATDVNDNRFVILGASADVPQLRAEAGEDYEFEIHPALSPAEFVRDVVHYGEPDATTCPDCHKPVEFVDDNWRHVDPKAACFLYGARDEEKYEWQHELLDRRGVPGWLLELLDGQDVDRINYAARNCSTRLYIRLLSIRADELTEEEDQS